MTTVVTIKATAPAVVISERIVDRERFENGNDLLEPNVEQLFIVHAGQSIRVVELPEQTLEADPAAPIEAQAESPVEATDTATLKGGE